MIDFACKKFDLNEVIRCSLNLTKKEFKILEYLMKNPKKEFTTQQIAGVFNIGLSTSQKAIKNISEKGLLKKIQKNLNKGGYTIIYSIKEQRVLKQRILEIIHSWVKKVEKEIENI